MLDVLRGDDAAALRAALIDLEAGAAPISAAVRDALIALLGRSGKEWRRRAAGALAVAAGQAEHRESLERALAAPDARTRWGAAFALARAGVLGREVAQAAIDALGDSDGDVRWAAAEIVCKAAQQDPAIAVELDAAAGSGVAERRKMALYCMRDIGRKDAAAFVAALDDGDRGVRLAALAGLAKCASLDTQSPARIAQALRAEHDEGVRRAAAATLAHLAEQHAVIADALAGGRAPAEEK